MKKVIIIAGLVLGLGGGGYFAWTQFGSGMGAAPEQQVAGDPVYFEMEPIIAPFIRDGSFAKYVTLIVNLELASDSDAEKAREFLPRLRDAFTTTLSGLAAIRTDDQRMVDIDRVRSSLLNAARRVLGKAAVRDVLIQLTH